MISSPIRIIGRCSYAEEVDDPVVGFEVDVMLVLVVVVAFVEADDVDDVDVVDIVDILEAVAVTGGSVSEGLL
jgi:hypothetical protein